MKHFMGMAYYFPTLESSNLLPGDLRSPEHQFDQITRTLSKRTRNFVAQVDVLYLSL